MLAATIPTFIASIPIPIGIPSDTHVVDLTKAKPTTPTGQGQQCVDSQVHMLDEIQHKHLQEGQEEQEQQKELQVEELEHKGKHQEGHLGTHQGHREEQQQEEQQEEEEEEEEEEDKQQEEEQDEKDDFTNQDEANKQSKPQKDLPLDLDSLEGVSSDADQEGYNSEDQSYDSEDQSYDSQASQSSGSYEPSPSKKRKLGSKQANKNVTKRAKPPRSPLK